MLTNAERRGIRREAEDILDGCEGDRLTEAQQAKFDSLMEQLRSDDLQRDMASAKSISADPNPKGQKQYRSHERIADAYTGANDLSLDRMIRGLATGYWDGADEARAVSAAITSAAVWVFDTTQSALSTMPI